MRGAMKAPPTEDLAGREADVLVAGAGPAGLSAARAAADAGASVLLVDAKEEIGLPVRCAEFVPLPVAREVETPDEAVAQAVEEMAVFVEGEEIGRVRSPGFVLHRERLEADLAGAAVGAGAGLVTGTRASPGPEGAVTLTREGEVAQARARTLVAADGPFSAFHREGMSASCMPAAQYTLRLARPVDRTEVRFARALRFGYAWVFPKGELANVGLACSPDGGRRELVPMLDRFVETLVEEGRFADAGPVRRTAGWIPVWGPPESAVSGNVLFAGDAGGFADPVTGGGIWPAIATGRMAGVRAARSALEDDLALLAPYDDEWRGLFGAALSRSRSARRTMQAEWDSRDLARLVRDIWPGL
jgi:geranylgeranyl reductase family protein